MKFNQAIDYIESFKPFGGSNLGLERIEELLKLMGNPQKKLKFVHIAGTNGKGSTASMIYQILIKAGYKTGLFTSPVIKNFNEQFKINNEEISDSEVCEITEHIKKFAEKMEEHPSEFELITALAFEYFYRNNCDIVILETGLGGRLDSTNIIDSPKVAVITSIGLDHLKELGDTIDKIVMEKTGIIKKGTDVVIYEQDEYIEEIILNECIKKDAVIHKTNFNEISIISMDLNGTVFSLPEYSDIFIPLLGEHQTKNALTAIKSILVLRDKGFKISDSDIYEGLRNVNWISRFEVIKNNPIVILDGGHNPQCAKVLSDNLKLYFKDKKIIFVIGVFKDKDYKKMMDYIIPIAKSFYTVTPNNPRGLKASELAEYINTFNIKTKSYDTMKDCLKDVMNDSNKDDVICINGSLSIAKDVHDYFDIY